MASKILDRFGYRYYYGRLIRKKHIGCYHKPSATSNSGNDIIKQKLRAESPLLVARIGLVELWIILNYLESWNKHAINWHDHVKEPAWKLAGIFPVENQYLTSFAKSYLDAISTVDVMGIWNNTGEDEVIRRYCPKADLVPLESIEPYFFEEPWSKELEGKKVLVIHPFNSSIEFQYRHNRSKLFVNDNVLPEFELKTIRAAQTLTYNTDNFNNWEEALEYMKNEIVKMDFDMAIIGAGGYGLILGAFVKSLNKMAIHMGGATQILFGIKGKRWEERAEFKNLFNEFWKKPYPEEQPENAMLHENGAYW